MNSWVKPGRARKGLLLALVAAWVLWAAPGAYGDHGGYGDGRERSRCYNGDCSEQEYEQWNSDQNNHDRRNRGAFSPGPFDDSPVDAFNGNTICLPGSTCYTDDRKGGEGNPPQR